MLYTSLGGFGCRGFQLSSLCISKYTLNTLFSAQVGTLKITIFLRHSKKHETELVLLYLVHVVIIVIQKRIVRPCAAVEPEGQLFAWHSPHTQDHEPFSMA